MLVSENNDTLSLKLTSESEISEINSHLFVWCHQLIETVVPVLGYCNYCSLMVPILDHCVTCVSVFSSPSIPCICTVMSIDMCVSYMRYIRAGIHINQQLIKDTVSASLCTLLPHEPRLAWPRLEQPMG